MCKGRDLEALKIINNAYWLQESLESYISELSNSERWWWTITECRLSLLTGKAMAILAQFYRKIKTF